MKKIFAVLLATAITVTTFGAITNAANAAPFEHGYGHGYGHGHNGWVAPALLGGFALGAIVANERAEEGAYYDGTAYGYAGRECVNHVFYDDFGQRIIRTYCRPYPY